VERVEPSLEGRREMTVKKRKEAHKREREAGRHTLSLHMQLTGRPPSLDWNRWRRRAVSLGGGARKPRTHFFVQKRLRVSERS